ncbi:multidrug effflux MFS transporter [Methylobacterium gregans]|uniref:Bcr/CflA family efflux transporter n=1 Tax=Methylobacterium gregans TaxID=374424 RepID=A0AA37HQH0_9HYPH|nr:multidrug effflux MFS transporter [Methylobacterium gregans]MDQ0521624.1 DHA1 family bicyclomycin/chloramphenicol resistance-like MFS transporter [Methylobacterium gregans]GJD80134.1 Bicyclomycin resistance protein [Methylobacterium gregans]GLS55381.1 Bcr/CflA family drug resistance efflux transporter [Methylobacterium gregans]
MSEPAAPACPERRASFPLLVAVTMTGTLALHIFVPALADAAADLGTTPAAAQLTITLFLVGLAGGQLVYGPLSDRYGRRPVLIAGLGLYLAGLLLALLAPNITVLVIARVLQSLGACSTLVIGRAMVRDVSASTDAARRMALLTMAMTLTPALAPALGGLVDIWLGWRAVFGVLALLVGVLGALVVFTLPETNRHPVALPGPSAMAAAYLRLLRIPVFRAYLVAGACAGTSLYAFLAVAPFLLVDRLGRSSGEVGLDCLIVVFGMVAGAVAANRLAGRVPIRRLARTGNLVCLAGAGTLLAIDQSGLLGLVSLILPLIVYAVGVGLVGPNAVAGLMNVDPRAAGAASSLYGFTQMTFGAVFTVAVGLWHQSSATPVAATLLGAATVAGIALRRA